MKKKRIMLIDINDLDLSEDELQAKYNLKVDKNKNIIEEENNIDEPPVDDIEDLRQEIMDDLSVYHHTDDPKGQTVLEPVVDSPPKLEKKKIIKKKQVFEKDYWKRYYNASRNEKFIVYRIISDAVDYCQLDYEYKGNGRPPAYYGDIAKAYCYKSFTNLSSWRAEDEFRLAKGMDLIDFVPCRSTINKYAQSKKLTNILDAVYKIIAEPLKDVEHYFCTDASGISNKYGNVRWSTIRHTKEEEKMRRHFSKVHLFTGYNTKIISSAMVTTGHVHESPLFKPLFKETLKVFNVREVYADAGYISKDNVNAVSRAGALPFIDSRRNIHVPRKGRNTAWASMLQLRKDNPDEWFKHYHRRPTVESNISALKRKYVEYCRSKLPITQKNEILAKIVCYNASILGKAMLKYDLNSGFLRRQK